MTGYFLMHRGWQENPIFEREEYSRRDAWIWLVEACCFRLTDTENVEAAFRTDSVVMSIKSLSKRFLWKRAKVATFLHDISNTDAFAVEFQGEDVCEITLLAWRQYVASLPVEPTVAGLPWNWPQPPLESRYIAQKDRKAVLGKGSCAYCGSTAGPFHVDHVKPFSRGGSNHRSNLALACQDCNLSKSNKPLSKWRRDHV